MYGKKNTFFPDQPPSSSSSSRYPYHTTNSKKLAFISQIVYPKTLLACDDLCYLIGWNNEQFECTIAGFVPVSIISKNLLQGYHELNKAIASSFDNVQFLGNKFQTDAKQPMILGIACPEDRNIDHSVLQEFHSNGIWLNLKIGTDTGDSGDTRKKLLKLKSIYSLGYPYDPVCYLVEYCPYNCNRFYCYLNSANGKEDSLLPTHSLTQVKIDLFQFQESTLKSFLFQSQKQSGISNTSTSHKFIPNGQKILTPTSQLSKKNRKFENIQLIISQMNISSDLISWIYYYLNKQPHQINNLLLIEKDQFRQFFLLKQFWINLLKKSNWILSYFVYLYFLFLKVVYYVITIELPFLETILHFTSWNEIAAAKVTMRNSTSEKKSKSNSSSRINSPSKTKRLSSTSTERSLPVSSSSLQSDSSQPPVAQSPARLTPAAPSFPSLNNLRSEQQIPHSNPQSSSVNWWSSPLQWNFYFPLSRSQFPGQKPRISKNMKKDYSFYHYSFFSHEIYQNIQLFQQLFLSHHQLFVNWNIIPNISCVKNFYQKFSFLQIYHGLIYLCLNSILGYLVCTYGYYILLSYIPEELLSSMTNNNNTTTGAGAGTEMTRNHDQSIYLSYEIIAKFIITTLQLYKENIIDSTLDWISHTPIGIKLNPFIIEKFNYLIQRCFHYYYLFLGNYYYSICFHFMWNFLHFFPWVGLTYQITLLLDMLMILTFPITLLHNLLSFVLKHHRDILYSLWLFFHGKKYNIFRNRIDTYSYSSSSSLLNPTSSMVMTSSQLLFGILLFSIMFFLLPNIIIYYLFFLMLRLQVIIVYLFFWNMIAVIKKFPFIYCFYYFMDFAFFTNRFYLQVFFPKTIHLSNSSSTPAAPSISSSTLSQGNYTNKRKNSRERNQLPSNNNNNMNMNMMMSMSMNDQDEQKKRNSKKSSMSLMNRIIRQNKLESPADPNEIISSEEESPDLSENNIKKSSSSLMPLIIPTNDLPSDQLSTDGERALNTTSMISEAGISTTSAGRQQEQDYLLPDRSHLMRLQQSPHSPTNANHLSSSPSFGIKSPGRQLRHRKNFMMSLTEQYRKEDDDERLKERQSFLARKRQEKLQIMEDQEEEESQQTEDDWNHSNPVTTTHHSLIIEQQQSNYYSSSALDTPTDVQNRKFFPPLPPAPAAPVLLPSSDDNAAVVVTAAALIQQRQQQQPQLSLSEYSDFESNSQLHNTDYSSLIEDKNNKRNILRTNKELDNLLYDNDRNLLHSSSSRDNYHGDPLPLSAESVVTDYQSHSFASHSQDRQQQQQQELLDTSLPLVTPMPSTVRMQLLPQSYSLFRLIKASLLIFFQADAFDSGDCNSCESQKLSTRSRIFLLLQAIYLSQPLNLIFWKNRFIFTLFDQAIVSTILKNNNNHNNSSISSSSPPTSSDSILFLMNESSNNDGAINYLEASYWEILQPSSPSTSVSLENEQSKEKKSQKMMDNPYVSYYRERILFHLLLVYSAYVLLVVIGMIYLVKFHYSSKSPIAQFVFSFLLSSDIPSSSSSLEESTSAVK